MVESFWSTMQREALERRSWAFREELAPAIFERIEDFYNASGATPRSPTSPRASSRTCHRRHRGGMINQRQLSGNPG